MLLFVLILTLVTLLGGGDRLQSGLVAVRVAENGLEPFGIRPAPAVGEAV